MTDEANTAANTAQLPVRSADIKDFIRGRVNQRFRDYAVLADYFPIKLKNGAVVQGVRAHCNSCQSPITSSMLRGEVRTSPEESYRVTAIGWCTECDLLSPFLFHVVPEGEGYGLKTLEPRGWHEAYQEKSVVGFEDGAKRLRAREKKKKRAANTDNKT